MIDTQTFLRKIESGLLTPPMLTFKENSTVVAIIDNVNGFIPGNSVGAYLNSTIEIMKNKYLYDKVSRNTAIDI